MVTPELAQGVEMNPNDKLTPEQAEEMLMRLTRHFNEPVLPMSKYCAAFQTWAEVVERACTDPTLMRDPEYPRRQYGHAYHEHLRYILLDIRKSNLLGRMLYGGEPLRTEKCPEHGGHWDGQSMLLGCRHGCDGTGWLKTPEMVTKWLEHARKVTGFTDDAIRAMTEPPERLEREQWLEWRGHIGAQ